MYNYRTGSREEMTLTDKRLWLRTSSFYNIHIHSSPPWTDNYGCIPNIRFVFASTPNSRPNRLFVFDRLVLPRPNTNSCIMIQPCIRRVTSSVHLQIVDHLPWTAAFDACRHVRLIADWFQTETHVALQGGGQLVGCTINDKLNSWYCENVVQWAAAVAGVVTVTGCLVDAVACGLWCRPQCRASQCHSHHRSTLVGLIAKYVMMERRRFANLNVLLNCWL